MVTPGSAVKNERVTFVAKCYNRTVMTNDNRTNITVIQHKYFRYVTMVIQNVTVDDTGWLSNIKGELKKLVAEFSKFRFIFRFC